MSESTHFEKQFLDALKAIFVGAKVEGESGYINLMHIKSSYFEKGVFPSLMKDIETACKPFEKGFREELFDKLYDFFKRYFSESGSIYFRHTPLHQNIYERVYTDDRDVILFWKTHMLFYVKTDRLFNSMDVEVEGTKFYFDASSLEHKRANERRELTYVFTKRNKQGKLIFQVQYSEKGRKTKIDEILKEAQNTGANLDEEVLQKAFQAFEKQSEVDYFINKNARSFLQEQFDLWLHQYMIQGESGFSDTRLKQLQALRTITYKVIDFIAQFEDELLRVWKKPKFVLNSHYIITLDKIATRDRKLLEAICKHKGMKAQAQEWKDLGMVDSGFKVDLILQTDLTEAPLHPQYQYLSIDTKFFPDIELDIVGLFEDLDSALDGWLVHSENYQALNTLLPKLEGKVKCVHIDPPYNTNSSGFLYVNAYQHSSWLSMMENRIDIARRLVDEDGSFLCHVDENEYDHLFSLFRSQNYNHLGTVVWDKLNPMMGGEGIAVQHEYIIWCSNHGGTFSTSSENAKQMLAKAEELIRTYGSVTDECRKKFATWVRQNKDLSGGEKAYQFINDDGRVYQSVGMGWPNPNRAPEQFFIPLIHPITNKPCPVPPRGWSRSPEKMKELLLKDEIIFGPDENTQPRRKIFLQPSTSAPLSSVIKNGQRGKAELDNLGLEFSYCHPTSLYEELLFSGMLGGDGFTLDFFAGSGTTAHAIINLNRTLGGKRKYILVEMGEHFNTVILPRIKKVVFSEKWKDGKVQNGKGISHFCKYYDLEQYEDTLRRAHYEDAPLFVGTKDYNQSYVFLRDKKLLDSVKVNSKENTVEVDFDALYKGIDLAETISCLTGKWIKRITKDNVEFQDGTTVRLTNPDWAVVKDLVWWAEPSA